MLVVLSALTGGRRALVSELPTYVDGEINRLVNS